jgi:putative 4-mercaptohistidine N1-methyltranferase
MHSATFAQASLQNSSPAPTNPYETDRIVEEYLLFHYGAPSDVLPHPFGPSGALDFAVRCVTECVRPEGLGAQSRALDLGCAVGRSSFELARWCGNVVGLDFSARFIAAAERIRQTGGLPYTVLEEGLCRVSRLALRPEGVDPDRIQFARGDAMNLPGDLGAFDVVLMANLIDRLRDPALCLASIARLVLPGGQLIITSPYTWMEEFTPRSKWLCEESPQGFQSSFEKLKQILSAEFILERTIELPFLIREHARKYQWSVAQATCWRRAGRG